MTPFTAVFQYCCFFASSESGGIGGFGGLGSTVIINLVSALRLESGWDCTFSEVNGRQLYAVMICAPAPPPPMTHTLHTHYTHTTHTHYTHTTHTLHTHYTHTTHTLHTHHTCLYTQTRRTSPYTIYIVYKLHDYHYTHKHNMILIDSQSNTQFTNFTFKNSSDWIWLLMDDS